MNVHNVALQLSIQIHGPDYLNLTSLLLTDSGLIKLHCYNNGLETIHNTAGLISCNEISTML